MQRVRSGRRTYVKRCDVFGFVRQFDFELVDGGGRRESAGRSTNDSPAEVNSH